MVRIRELRPDHHINVVSRKNGGYKNRHTQGGRDMKQTTPDIDSHTETGIRGGGSRAGSTKNVELNRMVAQEGNDKRRDVASLAGGRRAESYLPDRPEDLSERRAGGSPWGRVGVCLCTE